jgi:hypothetical protein
VDESVLGLHATSSSFFAPSIPLPPGHLKNKADNVQVALHTPNMFGFTDKGVVVIESVQSCNREFASRDLLLSGMKLSCENYHHVENSSFFQNLLPKKLEKLGYATLGIGEWHQSFDETSNVFQVANN